VSDDTAGVVSDNAAIQRGQCRHDRHRADSAPAIDDNSHMRTAKGDLSRFAVLITGEHMK
jgi:hypothetical protein